MNYASKTNRPKSKSRSPVTPAFFQAKLQVGRPGDKYEQEADRVADQVISQDHVAEKSVDTPSFFKPNAPLQRQSEDEIHQKHKENAVTDKNIQTKESSPNISTIRLKREISPLFSKPREEQIQRKEEEQELEQEEEEEAAPVQEKSALVQRKDKGVPDVSSDLNTRIQKASSGGSPLQKGVKSYMEPRFDSDFSGVRIHNDQESASLNSQLSARAFTYKNNIFFGKDQYQPESTGGKHLLAHELTHVVQQSSPSESSSPVQRQVDEVITPPDNALNNGENGTEKKNDAKSTMDSELSEVGAEPNVKVEKKEGEPTVLEPEEYPLPQNENADTKLPPEDKQETEQLPQESTQSGEKAKETKKETEQVGDKLEKNLPGDLKTGKKDSKKIEGNKGKKGAEPKQENNSELLPQGQQEEGKEEDGALTLEDQLPDSVDPSEGELEEVLLGPSPEENMATVQARIAEFSAYADQEKTNVTADAEAKVAEISAKSTEQIASIQQSIAMKTAEIEASFAANIAQLTSHAEMEKAMVISNTETDKAKVDTDTLLSIQELDTGLAQRKQEITSFVETESNQPKVISEEEVARAKSELEAAAGQAEADGESVARRYTSNEDPAPDQRRAAREVGRESASDIRKKIPAVREKLNEKAAEYEERYKGYAPKVHEKIDEVRESLITPINEVASSTKATLDSQKEVALQAIDKRLSADTEALEAAKNKSITSVQQEGEMTISNIMETSETAISGINDQKVEILSNLDSIKTETEEVVKAEEFPHVPAIEEIISSSMTNIQLVASNGITQLNSLFDETMNTMDQINSAFDETSNQIVSGAIQQGQEATSKGIAAITQTSAKCSTDAQASIANMTTQQKGIIQDGFAQIDKGIGEAKEEMKAVTKEFRGEAKEATDQSIEDAKKPLTDDTQTRAEAAAQDLEGSWLDGVIAAIGELLVGFLILVAIALVVAALTGLTLGGALLVVGAVFLVVATVVAYQMRSDQFQAMGRDAGFFETLTYALSDATGITGIVEGVTGTEFVTGRDISDAERGKRFTVGAVTLFGIIMGGRAAVKGFRGPPGTFMRTTSIFRGWKSFNFIQNIKGLWGDIVNIGTSIKDGVGRVYRAFKESDGFGDFFRRLFRPGTEASPDETIPDEGTPDETTPESKPPIVAGQEIIVDNPARIQNTEPQLRSDGKYYWDLYDTETGAIITQYVKASETAGPDMYLTPYEAYIPDVGQVKLIAKGFSWTDVALRLNIEVYRSIYNIPPPNLNGEIADSNMANFQNEYIKILNENPQLSAQEIANQAIRLISFGKHRIRLGFGDISVIIEETGSITVGGVTYDNVPTWVQVIAKPSGG
ncbi:DUF4157 domain-containing protein [Echinicola sp. 20G]|uniref:eCIS core domain-containing protein n=1 Tax=Echinicola sp. 20G TaxID=2781961 RepID=UPI0019103DF1|nr:DUF4157 domain-containing protein [Echinicola sp. 20G]